MQRRPQGDTAQHGIVKLALDMMSRLPDSFCLRAASQGVSQVACGWLPALVASGMRDLTFTARWWWPIH